MNLNPFHKAPPTDVPAETMILRGDRLEPEKPTGDPKLYAALQTAQEVYRRGDYAEAEKLFHDIADNKHNPPQIAEEARYYEAECLRRQEKYPKASDTYNKLLNDFRFGIHREQAMEREFEIANYWLDDTREEIRREKEKRDGKRWFIMPTAFVHMEKSKPLLDEEGRALETLEHIALNDLNGQRADEALFLAGSVKFFREDYKEADRYFSQLVDTHPNSKFFQQAMEFAIISKHMSTGGSDYDSRKVQEARKYVDMALRNYVQPSDKNAFLERQLAGITYQQAEKDFKIAEFYRRTNHPGAAYFYFEIVRRRYPGTRFADQAGKNMDELKVSLAQSQNQPGMLERLGLDSLVNRFRPEQPAPAPAPTPPTAKPASPIMPASVNPAR
jgi:TolA-binding protein